MPSVLQSGHSSFTCAGVMTLKGTPMVFAVPQYL